MAKRKSLSSIDAKIEQTKRRMEIAQRRYESLAEELKDLQQEREVLLAREIMFALKMSGKSYGDLMTFLRR